MAITTKQLHTITNLQLLLKNHLPLTDALELLLLREPSRSQRAAVKRVLYALYSGAGIADAFAKATQAFGKECISIIGIGVESGQLAQVLQMLLTTMRTHSKWRQQLLNKLSYPCFVLCAGIGLSIGLLRFMIPQMQTLYGDKPLPASTQLLFDIFESNSLWWPPAIIAVIFAIFLLFPQPCLRTATQLFPVVRQYYSYRSASLLHILLKSNVPIADATILLSNSMPIWHSQLHNTSQQLLQGTPVTTAFALCPFFHPVDLQMLACAEHSGSLATVLSDIAAINWQTMRNSLSTVFVWLEPLVMLCTGACVGVLALALYMPLFQMGEAFTNY